MVHTYIRGENSETRALFGRAFKSTRIMVYSRIYVYAILYRYIYAAVCTHRLADWIFWFLFLSSFYGGSIAKIYYIYTRAIACARSRRAVEILRVSRFT